MHHFNLCLIATWRSPCVSLFLCPDFSLLIRIPIIGLGSTLIHYDLVSIWLHLKRPYFHLRLHSQILRLGPEYIFLEDTIQLTTRLKGEKKDHLFQWMVLEHWLSICQRKRKRKEKEPQFITNNLQKWKINNNNNNNNNNKSLKMYYRSKCKI